ncbi:hypothetical protein CPAR01_03006 [Colletotrichum paranaense]|uniref:Uncharacterized protein n=1 Tax=Colletotrichum paranaense TaxID=1914294 RepID=A0ABQ9T198_9PEZI|nr:uncharacterized protein CPAR01_03006 [Colletotrichum paranaense]KAK1545504.1 hypothetical protein CPAR01_03006 [Colletotrichum paranaense]
MRVSEPIARETAAVDAQPVGAALSASPLSSSLNQWMREARSENRQGRHVVRKGPLGCTMCSPLKGLISPLDFVSFLPFLVITMASPIKVRRSPSTQTRRIEVTTQKAQNSESLVILLTSDLIRRSDAVVPPSGPTLTDAYPATLPNLPPPPPKMAPVSEPLGRESAQRIQSEHIGWTWGWVSLLSNRPPLNFHSVTLSSLYWLVSCPFLPALSARAAFLSIPRLFAIRKPQVFF